MARLDAAAKAGNSVSITAAGWDPGTDSVLRALFEAMVPRGTTFTNFGRGRSMGHSVAARAIKGVADAVSITIPVGGGRHSRLVYVVLEEGENLADVTARIKADDYFAHDPLDVRQCRDREELAFVADQSHGVLMERTGASGMTDNQILKFDMRINNPALTAQVLVSCARATTRLQAGCHTLIEVPPIAMLRGERMDIISRMVYRAISGSTLCPLSLLSGRGFFCFRQGGCRMAPEAAEAFWMADAPCCGGGSAENRAGEQQHQEKEPLCWRHEKGLRAGRGLGKRHRRGR